eukprot:935866-Pyramimonas_sp.AAC.1
MSEEVALHVDKAEQDAQARLLKQHNYGATILARDVRQWPGAVMRTLLPLAPSVELPTGPRSSRGVPKWPEAAMRTLPLGAF